jgi:polar amino acid transport system substrate-binding protein
MKVKWLSRCLLLLAIALIIGCHGDNKKTYVVARDPMWYPLDLSGKADNVVAFSDDLLQQICRDENITIQVVNVGWTNQFFNLRKRQYDGLVSSLAPININLETYDFSEPYLNLGEVLVVPVTNNVTSLYEMRGKEVGVRSGSLGVLAVEKFPAIFMRPYDNGARALEQLDKGELDGVVMGILEAYAFAENIYQGRLKVATHPLTLEALRLLVLKEEQEDLLMHFNHGLKKIKENGSYDTLLRKWGLHQ